MGMAREWLPDVGKLRRGVVGAGGAATPDALMEQGTVRCCAVRKSQPGEGFAIGKSNPLPQSLGGRARMTWEGLGRRGGRRGAALPSQALLSCLGGKFA